MTITKKEEAELLKVYNAWWDSYLNGDVKTYDSFLDDDFRFVGSTEGEEFLDRKNTTAFFEATAEQLAGKAKLSNVIRNIEPLEGMVLITDLADAHIINGDDWVYYARFRFTSLLRKTKKGWRFFYQHFSIPDLKAQEGETIGIDKVTAENLELRNAIKRRTSELELKNRDLEVEAALGRIRAKVTAMKQSADLLDIVVTMRTEFIKLGHEAHYFWHMRWLPDMYQKAMTSGDGSRIGMIMELPRDFHSHYEGMTEWENNKEPFIVLALETEIAVDYIDKMIKQGDFQQVDPNAPSLDDVRHIGGLTFVSARTEHGEIGYSLPGVVKNPPKEDLDILVRFAGAFDLAHKRFEDLRRSEQQARETKIELGLERVRARAMAMQDSSELSQLVDTVFKELSNLDFQLSWCIINIIDEASMSNMVWGANTEKGKPPDSYFMKFEDHRFHHEMLKAYQDRLSKWVFELAGKEKEGYDDYLFSQTEFTRVSEQVQKEMRKSKKYVASFTFSNFGGLQTIGEEALSDANLEILARFGKVFDLTYTRFNDLKLAETQARESRIELALERVRARTMAMQHSEELAEVATILFRQVGELGIPQWTCGFNIWETGDTHFTFYPGGPDGEILSSCKVPLMEHPIFRQFDESKKRGDELLVYEKEGKIQADHYRYMHSLPGIGDMLQGMLDSGLEFPTYQIDHVANFLYGNIIFITYEPFPEMHDVFKRFAKVFEQTYTRFLDLQKAEAQAKEAQIEAALERIRSKSMSMSSSKDIGDTVATLFHELVKIGHSKTARTGIGIFDDSKYIKLWSAITDQEEEAVLRTGQFDMSLSPSNRKVKNAWKRGDKDFYFEMKGPELINYYKAINESPYYDLEVDLKSLPEKEYRYQCYFKYGLFYAIDKVEILKETKIIFNKFSQVFEQVYTRFLDLQKAENQAREGQIETALERVRSRSNGMQSSEELKDVIRVIFDQLGFLNINAEHAGIVVDYKAKEDWHFWVAEVQDIPSRITVPYLDSIWDRQFTEAKKKGKDFFTTLLDFEEKNKFYEKMLPYITGLTKKARNFYLKCPGLAASTVVQDDIGLYIENFEGKPYSKEENSVLHRFGMVFQQTYTRFLDLKKAEAQAREAQIEAALEKIRSRTMAMQKGEELQDVVVLLYKELITLGVTNFATCGYVEINEKTQRQATWVTSPGGDSLGLFHLPLTGDVHFDERYAAWKKQQTVFHQTVAGKERRKHLEYAITTFNSKEAEEMVLNQFPDPTVFYCFNFSHGYLHVVAGSIFTEEEETLLARFTRVFEQTYARFLDLKKAEAQAREAQINLAVERVRAKALAMHKSEEIMGVVAKLKEEVMALDIPDVIAATIFLNEGDDKVRMWDLSTLEKDNNGYQIPFDITFKLKKRDPNLYVKRVWENPENYFIEVQEEKDFKRIIAWLRENDKNEIADEVKEFIETTKLKRLHHAVKKLNNGKLVIDLLNPPSDEMETILTKMGGAFDLAYKRFEDLQKAEAQAKEAQIEAALERVRSRSMAMHKSEELLDVISVVSEQLLQLNFKFIHVSFVNNDNTQEYKFWTAAKGLPNPMRFTTPYIDIDVFNNLRRAIVKSLSFYTDILTKKEHRQWHKHLLNHGGSEVFSKEDNEFIMSGGMARSIAINPNIILILANYTSIPYSENENKIIERLGQVFEQSYTRFLDLQKAEAQARKAQIEGALERVRSKTMAMHNSQDVGATIRTMFDELVKLGIEKSVRCGIGILDHTKPMELWTASSNSDGEVLLSIGFLDMSIHPLLTGVKKAWEKKEVNFTYELKGENVIKYFTALNEAPDYLFQTDLDSLPKKIIHNSFPFSEGTLFAFSPVPLTKEEEQIFKRFTGVFAQTYTRYLDLLKAEAQTIEVQIEAALERVRSKTMAMHSSSDVKETVKTFFDEVLKLGIDKTIRCGIGILEGHEGMETWSANATKGGEVEMRVGMLNMNIHPMLRGLKKAWKNGEKGYSYYYTQKDVLKYYTALNNEPEYPFNADLDHLPKREYHNSFFFSSGIIFAFTENPLTEESSLVLHRFAEVFGQTYRRYLDLQKAEAQALEAQIEASLEKVRSRTMAMQSSSELVEAANLLFNQVKDLGVNAWSAGYNILSEDKTRSKCWMSSEDQLQDPFPLFFTREASFIEMGKFLKSDETFFVQELGGKALKQHYDYMISIPELEHTFKHIKNVGLTLPEYQINHLCKFKQGFLLFITYEKSPEAHDIFKRFTKVFEQTYTRFLDLQKAEIQSKEAQIELALERVRASSMAMHQSEQLAETAEVLFEQFDLLGIIPDRISIAIYNEKKRLFELWSTDQSGTLVNHGHDFSIEEPTCMAKTYKAWAAGKEFFTVDLEGKELEDWIRYVKEEAKMELDESEFQGRRVQHAAFFSQGYLLLSSHLPISDETEQLLVRFTKVFQQTYTRFLDLQKAEKQVREAIKRASVDRVRAEIASMRTGTDLNRITPLVWNELTTLDVPFIRCGVFIMDEETQQVQTHLSTPEGKAIASFELPFENTAPLENLVLYWRKNKMYTDYWDESAFVKSINILMQRGKIESAATYMTENKPTSLYLHFLPFLQGMLYVGSEISLNKDELSLVQNLADAFSSAYARYEDFNKLELANIKIEKTLVDLKQTQTQLVQSEKMASLGELTAGIAHEIQNPLNFVNNFSEVSVELIEEMNEEIEEGNLNFAKEIATDLKQNLDKINHHGKRAGEIVKGMLQHSRTSSGQKELTNINALADEYLRLAYHGLRAKDKSFNAKMESNFDPDLPELTVIPQDIGRVILNMITNAFYAVNERKKQDVEGYEPMVNVSTKKRGTEIEIKVKDNGKGMPKEVKEKIFQPFFTTKPTGQGTGLGLSLSYDIIIAHGGEIKVESKENEGTEFIIQLPI